jgi:hypothetical protein
MVVERGDDESRKRGENKNNKQREYTLSSYIG